MTNRVYSLHTPWTDIDFIPKCKVSLWYGFGSEGKSVLCEYLLHNNNKDFTYMGANVLSDNINKVILIDDDALALKEIISSINNSDNLFVLLTRRYIPELRIPYEGLFLTKIIGVSGINTSIFTIEPMQEKFINKRIMQLITS